MIRGAVVALAAIVLVAGSLSLTRPGYSVDEEFTVLAVRGIRAHGLPLLPSGLLYDRGIAYSYASWLAGSVTGAELPAFRAVSVASASLVVLLTFLTVRRIASEKAALTASIFVTLSVPFWATATSARFYAPFLGAYLLALYLLTHRHWWIGLIAAAALARLTHELAFTLGVIPATCWLVGKGERRRWLLMTAAVAAGLVIGQLVLFLLHALEPSSGETMVRRFFLWQVLNLFERPAAWQFGIPLAMMLVAILIAPSRRRWWIVGGVSMAAMIAAFSVARATNSAPLSAALIAAVLEEGARYPLDMFWHIARTTPLTLIVAIGAIAARSAGAGGEWRPAERAAHLLWLGWVLWFGVIESGITTNYLLLPLSFMVIAVAIDLEAITRHAGLRATGLGAAVLLLGIAGVAADQWRGDGSPSARLEAARPTIHAPGIDEIREGLQPNDRVVCTDEIGCLMLVGRIDRWLALDDYVRERFIVRRQDGAMTGVYTGVPAVFRPNDVFSPNPDGTLPDRTIVVDVFKEFPIGNSRSWLPRAIEEDGLVVTPLLETAQLRVLQISPPERHAHLR